MLYPKPKKVKHPEHDFPASWYGWRVCIRCGATWEEYESGAKPWCITDEAIAEKKRIKDAIARLKRIGIIR